MQTEHRIDELIVDLSFNTTRLARHETALLSEWLREDLLPALDNLFSHYAPGKQILRFETLEFNLGNLTSRNYQQTIREQLLIQFAQLLQTQLLAVIPESKRLTADRLNGDSGQGHLALQQLLRYLATGQLAAHYPSDFTSLESRQNKQSRAEIKSALHGQLLDAVIAQHNIADLLRELPQRDALIQRLLTQFSVIQRMELLRQLAPQHVQWVIALLDLLHFFENNSQAKGVQLLDEQAIRLQQSVWQALLQLGLTQPNANEQVWINDILPRLASTLSLSEIQLRQDLATLALPVNNTELLNLQVQIAKSLQASNLAEGKVEIPLQIIPAQSDARQNQSSGDDIPTGSSQQTQDQWRQLLAAAWIRADAQQLQKFWPQLIAHEQALLLASIQHYLPQAEIRQQLMLRLPLSLQIDIVALLAPSLKNTFHRLQQQAAQLSNYIAVQIEPFPTTATANKKNNDNNQSDPQSAELVARQLWEISLGLILNNKSKNINSEISSHVFLKDLAKRYAELHNLESTALHQIFEQFVLDHKKENILENENFSRQDKQANSTELTGIAHSSAKEAANHNSAPLETTLPTATAGEDKYPLVGDNLITISDHQLFDLCLRLKSGSQAWSSLALEVALLKRLISSYIRLGHSATGENCADFVAAINNHAQSSHVPSAFYLAVLQALISDQLIDLELIAQQIPSNAMALADKNNNLSTSENTEIAKELNSIKNQQKISQGTTAAGTTEINNMAAIAQALLSNRQPSVLLQALEFDKLQWQQLTIAVIQQAPFFDQEARAELTAASQTPISQLVNPAAYYQAIITAIIERQPFDLEAIAIIAKDDNAQSEENSSYKDTAEPAEKNIIYDRNQEMAQPATKTGMQNPARTTTVDVGQISIQDSAKVTSESVAEQTLDIAQQATEIEKPMRTSALETTQVTALHTTEPVAEQYLQQEIAGTEQRLEIAQQATEIEKPMRTSALETTPTTGQHTTELVAEHYLQQEIAGIEQKQKTVQQALESDTENLTRHSAQKVAQTSKQDITQSAPAIITSASSIVDIAKALLSEQQPSVLLQGLEFDKQQWQQLTIAVIQQAPFFDQEARAELTAASQTPISQLVNPAAYYQAIITAIIERQPLDLEAIAITAKTDNTQSAENSLYKDTAEPAEKNIIYDRNQEMAQPAATTVMQNPARTTSVDVGKISIQDSAKVASESLVETRLHEENAGVEQKQESVQQATELKFETSMRNSAEETMDIAAQLKTESASEARLHKENAGAEQKQEAVQQTTELETEKSMRSSALEKIPPTALHTTELVAEHYLQQEIAGIEQKQETVQQALESDTKNSTRHSAQKVAQTSKQDITQSAPAIITSASSIVDIAKALLSEQQPSVLLQGLEFDKQQWQQLTIAVIQQAPFFDQEARAELTAASQTPINQLVNPAAYYQAIITAIIERQPLDLEAIAIIAKDDNAQSEENSSYKDTAEPAEKNIIYDRNQEMAQPATKTGMQNSPGTTTVDVGQISIQDSAKVTSESVAEHRLHNEDKNTEQTLDIAQQATEIEKPMRTSALETTQVTALHTTEPVAEQYLQQEIVGTEQRLEIAQQATEIEKPMRTSALETTPTTGQHTTELVAEHYLQQEIAGIEQKQKTVQQALESDTENLTRHSAQKVAQTSKQDITQSAPAIITSASSIVDIAKALLSEQQPSVLLQGLEFDKQQWQQLTIAVIQQAPFFDQEARAELTAASQTPISQLVNPAAYYQAIITAIIERQPLDLEAIAITAKTDNTQSAENSLYKDTAEPAEKNIIYDRNQEMAQPAATTVMQNPARTTSVDVGKISIQDSAKVASESLVETRLHEENAGVEQKQESVQQATELKFETSMRNSAEETMDIAAQLKTESASEARLHKENAGAEQKQEAVQQTTELETEKSMRSSALEKIPPTALHTTELVAEHYLQQEIAGIEQKQETVQQALESDTKNSTRHSAQKVTQTSKQDITQSAPAPTTSVKSIVDIAQVLLSEREPLSLLQGLRFDQAQWQQLTVALMQQEPLIHLGSNTDLIKAIQLHALKTVRVSAYYQLLINSILQRQPIDLEACVAAAVDGAGLVNKNTNNENLLDTDNRQSEQPILHQAMDYLPISEKDRSIDNTGLLLPALLGAELPLNREQLLALQQYINQLLNRPTQAIFAEWRALLAIAQHARVLINSIPAHLLHRIIMRLQPERYPWLDAVVKIVMEALALLVADTNSLLIKQTKWEFIFNYVFSAAVINTSQTPAQALDLAIELCGRLANATGIEDEQRLVNLTQRRLALLRPPATLKPAMRLQEINTNPTTNNDETTPQWESGLHINNAGQVLAGAFLPRLFSMLNLIQDGKFIHPAAADRAVHLVQFMVTGQSSTPEYDLILNKILCGISSSIPISAGIEITEQERTLIEQMLTSMIQHWKVLGSTSISGLRETFFQRQGWLVLEEDCWRLKVKEQTFDLLLDRLPWSISLIKHGWMDKPLRVSWRDFS